MIRVQLNSIAMSRSCFRSGVEESGSYQKTTPAGIEVGKKSRDHAGVSTWRAACRFVRICEGFVGFWVRLPPLPLHQLAHFPIPQHGPPIVNNSLVGFFMRVGWVGCSLLGSLGGYRLLEAVHEGAKCLVL